MKPVNLVLHVGRPVGVIQETTTVVDARTVIHDAVNLIMKLPC
jgi:hypothetical protein